MTAKTPISDKATRLLPDRLSFEVASKSSQR
jgi:hypothetical protein